MKVRIAVIGCGAIMQRVHAPEIVADNRCELAGVFDINRSHAEDAARMFHCSVYDSVDDIMEDKTIDAVYVLVPNKFHAEMAVKAFEHGKHVMCEKPLAVTKEDCRQMLDASRKAGKYLMVGHNMRFDNANVVVHDLLASGKMGRVFTIRSSVAHSGPDHWSIDPSRGTWFFKKDKAVFGAMGDVGVHKMDLIRYLLDDDIDRVTAMTGTLDKTGEDGNPISVEDNAVCLFVTKKGVQGVMKASWCNYGSPDMSTDILCENGRIRIKSDDTYPVIVDWKDGTRSNIRTVPTEISGVTRHFLDAIIDGRPNPNLGASGCKTVACVVACIESAASGSWVKVDNEMFEEEKEQC